MNLLDYLGALGSALLIFSYFLIRYYASTQTSCSTQLLATCAFALGFSGTVLLPIDLSLTEDQHMQDDDKFDSSFMLLPWHILFWSTFILAWLILPLVREIILSGEFTIYRRFKDGMRKLLVGHLILLSVVTVFIVWLAIYLKEINVIPVLIALGNTYGLLLVAVLLGYGLVAFPRSLWRQAKPEHELRKIYLTAVKTDDRLFEAVWQLQDVEFKIDSAVTRITDLDESSRADTYYKFCVNELLYRKAQTANLDPDLNQRRTTTRRNEDDIDSTGRYDVGDRPSMEELVNLHRTLKRAQENLFNAEQKWNDILKKKAFLSGINLSSIQNDSSSNHVSSSNKATPLSPTGTGGAKVGDAPLLSDSNTKTCRSIMKYIWTKFFRGVVYRLLSLVFAIMSIAILWSEATLASSHNLSPFALIQEKLSSDGNDQEGILFQVAALVPLLYMAICTSNALFQVGRFGPYCLRGNRQSHGVALVFNAQYLVRLQFPLAYNYLMILKYDTSETAFSNFIGQMDVVPLFGKAFPVYAPLLILLLCTLTFFNFYARLMNLLGFEHQDGILLGDKDTLDAKVNEGKNLLQRHMNSIHAMNSEMNSSVDMNKSFIRQQKSNDSLGSLEMSEKRALNDIV